MRKIWILPFFIFNTVVSGQTMYDIRINTDINLRTSLNETGEQQEVVRAIRTLPKGSVIRVTKENYDKYVALGMKENPRIHYNWMQGIEVVSIPGVNPSDVEKLNEQPNLMSYNLVTQAGKIVETSTTTPATQDVQLSKPAQLYRQDFVNSSPHPAAAVSTIARSSSTVKYTGVDNCKDCTAETYFRDNKEEFAEQYFQVADSPIQTKEEMMRRLKQVSQRFNASSKNKIPDKAIQQTLDYINKKFNTLPNRRFVTILDYTKSSREERTYLLDLETGETVAFHSRHGRNAGDPPKQFSNVPNSGITPRGFHVIGDVEICNANYSYSAAQCRGNLRNAPFMRLRGQEPGINDNSAYARGILIHSGGEIASTASRGQAGRSEGCPSMEDKIFKDRYLKGFNPKTKAGTSATVGSLYFIYSDAK